MTTVTQEIPQALLDLAAKAIVTGFGRVSLSTANLAGDGITFSEWELYLAKPSQITPKQLSTGVRESMRVVADPVDTQAIAFTGTFGEEPFDQAAIEAWMSEPIITTKKRHSFTPLSDQTLTDATKKTIELFTLGAKNGWDMGYEIVKLGYNIFGREQSIVLHWSAFNRFYGAQGHPASHAIPSFSAFTTINSFDDGSMAVQHRISKPNGGTREISESTADYLLGKTAPWYVPLAYFDEDLQKEILPVESSTWEHNPEALNKARIETETIMDWVRP